MAIVISYVRLTDELTKLNNELNFIPIFFGKFLAKKEFNLERKSSITRSTRFPFIFRRLRLNLLCANKAFNYFAIFVSAK